MAFIDQAKKKELAPGIQAVLKQYGMKGTLAIDHYSELVVNVRSGKLDFPEEHTDVNHYHIDTNHKGEKRDFLNAIREASMQGNHDNSDMMTDYFDVGWYLSINVGTWDKPYICTA